ELESVCAQFARQIKGKNGEKARFLADPKLYIVGDKATNKQPNLQSGDLVEGVGADKVTAHAGGATVWRNPHLQFVDASGQDVSGKQAELDFLLLSPTGVQEIISAKMNADNVRPTKDRKNLSKFYLPELDPLDLSVVASKFGSPSAYQGATA